MVNSGIAPDLIEPVIGYRQWRVVDGQLRSPFQDLIWERAELDARCPLVAHPEDEVASAPCSCGVHAYYELSPRTASAGTPDLVAGAVVLWGTLQLHISGMRASHARIVALALPLSRGRKRRELAAAAADLGVPAVSHRQVTIVAHESGAPLPSSMRPPRQRLAAGPYWRGASAPA